MNVFKILVGTTLIGSIATLSSVYAVENLPYTPIPTAATILPAPLGSNLLQATPAETAPLIPHEDKLLHDASTIMGHIGVADIALLHEIYPEATANVKSALEATREMIQNTERFTSSEPIALANLSYRSAKGEQNFWLPLLDNHFVVRSMDGYFLKSKKPEVQATDAQIVHYRIYLNLKTILQRLEDAESALKKRSYKEAEFALQESVRGTFIDRLTPQDALGTTLEHIILASELLKDRNYISAAAAIGHARLTIAALQSGTPKKDKRYSLLASLVSDMSDVQTRLLKWPNASTHADTESEKALDRWIKDIPSTIGTQQTH